MNKVILMGRLTKDPEVRYSQAAEPIAVARYTLAVNRRFKREGEPDADFINCVSFGKTGEFAEKYFKKGQLVSVVGRIQVRSWDDQAGQKHWSTEVVVEDQYFAESKASFEAKSDSRNQSNFAPPPQNSYQSSHKAPPTQAPNNEGFFAVDQSMDDEDLPF